MSESEKQKVLHYAEIALKGQRNELNENELREMEEMRKELGMEHEAILELAVQKLFPED